MEKQSEKVYLTAKNHHSIEAWIEALGIFARYAKKGEKESYFCQAEHDCLHIHVPSNKLTEDSEDGQRLLALGFQPDDENNQWMVYT